MATIIDMPKLSDTMSVGTVVKWHKQEGDKVSNGDVLAEIETDKATMELENFDDGIVLKIFAEEGSEIPIGQPLAVVGESGENVPEIAEEVTEHDSSDKIPSGDEVGESALHDEIQPKASEEPSIELPKSDYRIFASPLAKKIALEKNIDLSQISGSGPSGRIVKRDVLQTSSSIEPNLQSTSKPVNNPPSFHSKSIHLKDESVPVSKMRSIIAKRLLDSKSTIPHFYLQKEVSANALLNGRKKINEHLNRRGPEEFKVSVNDLIMHACAHTIGSFPEINSTWHETEIHMHGQVNLAFGVAIDDGLVTPVINEANTLSIQQISIAAKQLISQAREKKLSPDQMAGSTFTITNLGMFGVDFFSGIINPPNAAILSVGACIKKPIVDSSGNLSVGDTMMLGLSCDHRLVDGAIAAQFLQSLAESIEHPAVLLV
ncbi:MAG: dihydrolipoamide acetyltransferase family protein [Verrucomicrobiota bacterium]|nr:dihydrolipoamide acetyltransferase family protein [Verrucomicrobiota bacterium]